MDSHIVGRISNGCVDVQDLAIAHLFPQVAYDSDDSVSDAAQSAAAVDEGEEESESESLPDRPGVSVTRQDKRLRVS